MYWIQMDIIIESEKKKISNCVMICNIPNYDMNDGKCKYNLRGMIQRIYVKINYEMRRLNC